MIMTKKSFNTVLIYFVEYCIKVLVDSISVLEEDCRSPDIEMLANCCALIGSWHVLNSTPSQWRIPLIKSLAVQNTPHCEDVRSWKPPGSLSTFLPLRLNSLQTMAMPPGSCIWNWTWLVRTLASRRVSQGLRGQAGWCPGLPFPHRDVEDAGHQSGAGPACGGLSPLQFSTGLLTSSHLRA